MKIFFYGNCQASLLARHIMQHFPDISCDIVLNFEHRRQQRPLPRMTDCDVFVYQPIEKAPGYNTNDILSDKPDHVLTIGFPYIYFTGYFPGYEIVTCADSMRQLTQADGRHLTEPTADYVVDNLLGMFGAASLSTQHPNTNRTLDP